MTGTGFAAILALALGLAMDAMAAAAACGVATPILRPRHFATVAVYFGGFQGLMPLLGWLLAAWIGPAIAAWDHWIALVLLGGIGAKMLHAAWAGDSEAGDARDADMLRPLMMLGLAVATSIDAFAAGITLPLFEAPIAVSLATIAITTAALSALGLAIGRRLGDRLGRGLDALGGAVLIGLGVKLLVEHLTA